MAFPTQVNVQQAYAVNGDFASRNPRYVVPNNQGGYIAGPNGVTIGAFCWADAANLTVSSTGVGVPTGFVAREVQGTFNTSATVDSGFSILPGFPVTVFSIGDFFVTNKNASVAATVGMKAYASPANGSVTFAATGSPTAAATVLGANQTIVANTFAATTANNTFVASISGTVMTVTAITTGLVFPGQVLSGGSTSVNFVDTNTTVVNQLTGTAGSTGTYTVSISQTVGSCTITGTGSCLTITGRTSGALLPGQVVSGTGIPTGTTIVSYGTFAAGGIGTSGTIALSAANTSTGSGVTITGVGGYLTVATAITGTIGLYDPVTDTTTAGNMPSGTVVSAFLTGTGGLGTYMLSTSGSASASTDALSFAANIETGFSAKSAGLAGELVIMGI